MRAVLSIALFVCATAAHGLAQDTRTVSEPSFPPVCKQLAARLSGGLTGLGSGSETQFDTPTVQAALDTCPAGQAVELRARRSANAFLIAPIRIPSGVTLLVDAGVTVYASRNPRDYDANSSKTCGTLQTSSGGCMPLITVNRANGSGIMGYGIIDGRGHLPMLIDGVPAAISWWQLARQASGNLTQNNPRMLQVSNTDGFTLYKITLMNSPNFHVAMGTDTNVTVWGVKIIAPYDARNTDGIDPGYSSNVTITKSYISDGDDNVAVGGSNSPGAKNISVVDNWFGDGHGASIGSYTQAGVGNVLFDRITMAGTAANGNATGLRIKSDVSRGGLVQNITYSNICMQNIRDAIVLDPFYTAGATGSLIPSYQNIVMRNVHATTEGLVHIMGHDANVSTTVTMDNVQVDGIKPSDVTLGNAEFTLGPNPVNLASMLKGTGVTVKDGVTTSNPPYSCPVDVFAPVAGELIPGLSRQRGQMTVGVQVFTTKAVPYQTYLSRLTTDPNAQLSLTPPSGTVTIYDGTAAIGSGMLDGQRLVRIPIGPLAMGSHTLTAVYSGDANYPSFAFGNYTLEVR